jgi:hypothetical protein
MKIFISYRRDDSAGHTGRLFDRLSAHFGSQSIFMDIDTIQPGEDFRKAIAKAVSTCNVALVMIGKQWLSVTDENGRRRLDNPGDFVRAEIASALVNPQIRVIPVLVRGAVMPSAHELPDELKELSWRNATELSDNRFQYDVNKLIGVIEHGAVKPVRIPLGGKHKNTITKYWRVVIGLVCLGLVIGVISYGIYNIRSLGAAAQGVTFSSETAPASTLTTPATATSTIIQDEVDGSVTATIELPPTENTALEPSRISNLSIRKPTLNEIRENMLSIWDANLLTVKDIRSPGTNYYDGEANVGQEYLWTWHWCTTTKETLQSNRLYMTVRFYINGEILPSDDKGPIFVYDYDLVPTNTPCAYWSTVIGGWRSNENYKLKITYTFTENVDDGSNVYPRGEYSHVLEVTAK